MSRRENKRERLVRITKEAIERQDTEALEEAFYTHKSDESRPWRLPAEGYLALIDVFVRYAPARTIANLDEGFTSGLVEVWDAAAAEKATERAKAERFDEFAAKASALVRVLAEHHRPEVLEKWLRQGECLSGLRKEEQHAG